MGTLSSIPNQQDHLSDEISIPLTGQVQVFIRGQLGPRGSVSVLLKGADGQFHAYRELIYREAPTAQGLNLTAGDRIKVQFKHCESASVEVRQ